LSRLNPGEVLEVILQDEEVVESLSMILKQSQDSLESLIKEESAFASPSAKVDRFHPERLVSGTELIINLEQGKEKWE